LPERTALGLVETRRSTRRVRNRAHSGTRVAFVAGKASGGCGVRSNSGGATVVCQSRRGGNSNNSAERLNTRDVIEHTGRRAIGQLLTR
jgi:hypothetical protein